MLEEKRCKISRTFGTINIDYNYYYYKSLNLVGPRQLKVIMDNNTNQKLRKHRTSSYNNIIGYSWRLTDANHKIPTLQNIMFVLSVYNYNNVIITNSQWSRACVLIDLIYCTISILPLAPLTRVILISQSKYYIILYYDIRQTRYFGSLDYRKIINNIVPYSSRFYSRELCLEGNRKPHGGKIKNEIMCRLQWSCRVERIGKKKKKTRRPSLLIRACRRRKTDRFPRYDKPENNGYSRCSIQRIIIIIIIAHLYYSNNRASVITSLLLVLFGMSLV